VSGRRSIDGIQNDIHPAAGRRVASARLLVGLGQPFLWEPDEPRFAEATRQMLLRGDLLTPWFQRPAALRKSRSCSTGFQLPFYLLLGPSELAARLPSALAAPAASSSPI